MAAAFCSIPLTLTSTVARSSEVCQLYRSGDVNASRRQPPAALEELINSQLKRTFGKHSEVATRLPVRCLRARISLSLSLFLSLFRTLSFSSFPSITFYISCKLECACVLLVFARSYLRAHPLFDAAQLRALIKIVKSVSTIRRD